MEGIDQIYQRIPPFQPCLPLLTRLLYLANQHICLPQTAGTANFHHQRWVSCKRMISHGPFRKSPNSARPGNCFVINCCRCASSSILEDERITWITWFWKVVKEATPKGNAYFNHPFSCAILVSERIFTKLFEALGMTVFCPLSSWNYSHAFQKELPQHKNIENLPKSCLCQSWDPSSKYIQI